MTAASEKAALTFGIIGAGNRRTGTARGDQLARMLPVVGGRVTAFYDLVEENARRAAAAFDGACTFTDLEAFLDSGIDACVICSPVGCHVEQAIPCLERDIHVLSEVPAAGTLEDGRLLVEAASRSSAHYMLAENYCYYDEIELVKRMVEAGRFGQVYFAEGAYTHDCKFLWRNEDGSLTWRGEGFANVYCTHSLGPLLYILQDRVKSVSCLANPSELYDPEIHWQGNHLMLMRTEKERTVLVRVDHLSSREWDVYYSLQGNRGAYKGDRFFPFVHNSAVWLADDHETCKWQRLWDYAEQYIPDRLRETERLGEKAKQGGHGNTEYWMLKDFLESVQKGTTSPIDVHVAMDYTVPGIVAAQSAEQEGTTLPVPDSRDWAE